MQPRKRVSTTDNLYVTVPVFLLSLTIMPALAITRLHYTVDTLFGFALAVLGAATTKLWLGKVGLTE